MPNLKFVIIQTKLNVTTTLRKDTMRQYKPQHMSERSGTITYQDNSPEHRQNLKGDTNTKKPATPTQSMSRFQNPKNKSNLAATNCTSTHNFSSSKSMGEQMQYTNTKSR